MTHQWLDPISGSQTQSDDSPGLGWLGIVEVTLVDGSIVESTLPGAEAWLNAAGYNAPFNQSWLNVSVILPTEEAADDFESEVIPILSGCRYFVFNRDAADPNVWVITIDPNADSYDPDEYHVVMPGDDSPDLGGGGGRPGPPPDPDRPPLPFPGPGGIPVPPGPPVSPPIQPPIQPPPDPTDDILKKAREAADKDAGGEPGGGEQPGDVPGEPNGEGPTRPAGDEPCPNCDGTGTDPGDDEGDGGDGESDESGSGDPVQDAIDEAEKEDLEDEYLEALHEGDQEAVDDLLEKLQELLDKEGTPGDEPGDQPGECKECGGSGSCSPDPGDEEEDEGDSEDELPAVVHLANETIKKANETIRGLIAGEGMDILLLRARECNDLADKCESVADPRSVTQREVIQRALDAAERSTAAASKAVWEGQ